MKYQRFDPEDVAEILRNEIQSRQAKAQADHDALMGELVGPHKATWDFWKALFDRRDVKALADFEGGDECQAALEYSIRVLETSPGWAGRPERNELLVKYRRRRVERASRGPVIGEPHQAEPVQKGRPRSNVPERLEEILVALESYAANTEQEFDRSAMPGPLGDDWQDQGSFHWLCAQIHPAFKRAKATFEKHRAGLCAIHPYAPKTDFYKRALPYIAPKLKR